MSRRLCKYSLTGLVVLAILIMGFAAGCGSAAPATTTVAPAATTTSLAATDTTAAATDTTAAATDSTAASTGSTADNPNGTSGTIVVKGLVDNPMTITAADLKKMKVITETVEHPKLGTKTYSGVLFSDVLPLFKIQSKATVLDVGCTDGYMAEIAIADIQKTANAMLAIGDDGSLNLVMPGMFGKAWANNATSFTFN